MKLWVGLGNPGAQYAGNRHNVGFRAVEAIADAQGLTPWRAKFQGQVAEGRLGGDKVLLLKPGTFMNLSGDAVQAAVAFYKIAVGDVVVFHDELDLAPGKCRIKRGGGHAGHNGLRSIAAHLGPDFTRVRLGIGHPGDKRLVSNYVLGDFAKADEEWLAALLRAIGTEAPLLARGDTVRFLHALGLAVPKEPAGAGTEPRPLPKAAETAPQVPDARTPLQRLVDRFR